MKNLWTSRRPTYALAGVLVVVLGFFPFLRHTRVPILGWVDLAIHEAGHVFFLWAPHDVTLFMGGGFQVLVPLVFAAAFVVQQRDLAGGAVALAWAGSALQDVSVYIADAPFRDLPLLGPEDSHDWWQLLGGHGLLPRADDIAGLVLFLAWVVYALALATFAVGSRWDAIWREGDPGVLYWPWQRQARVDREAREALLRQRYANGHVGSGPGGEVAVDADDEPDPPVGGSRVVW